MERGPFNEDSGRFPVLIDMERADEELVLDVAEVGEQIDEQLERINERK